MRALLGVLYTAAVALTAGYLGFQAGIASNIGAAGGTVVLGGGFPWFGLGFLFFLFFLGFVAFAVGGMRRRAWASGGPGHWAGHGAWATGDDPRHQWIAEAHRRLHEEDATATTSGASARPTTASPTDRPAAG